MHLGLSSCFTFKQQEICRVDGAVTPSCKVVDTSGVHDLEFWFGLVQVLNEF